MAEARYTWGDIIIDPSSEEAKNAVGKECYFGDSPAYCLNNANSDDFLYVLDHVEVYNVHPFVDTNSNAYGCIIVKKEQPSYKERSKRWVEENDLKVGDYVKVTRKAESREGGCDYLWNYRMDNSVGKILKVEEIKTRNGVITLEDACCYPYFVLEKAKLPKPRYIPFESKEEFIEAFHYHDNANCSETEDILMNYGMWIKSKDGGYFIQVTIIRAYGIYTNYSYCPVSWENLLEDYTFIDGSSCGKLREESDA